MAKGFIADVKKTAIKNVASSLSRSGLVGKAIGKAINKKFGDPEKDDSVQQALKEQADLQNSTGASLARIESVVLNIADNVYNIASIMNAQVTSMKEAQRLQQERSFREAAAQEEQDAEASATKVGGPEASATTPGEGGKKKGMMGSMLDALSGSKKMFKTLLKRFAVVAAGLGIAAGAVYMASKEGGDEEPTGTEGTTGGGEMGPPTPAPESPTSLITSTSTPPPQATPAPTPSATPAPTPSATTAPTPSDTSAQTSEQGENAFQLNKSLTGVASEMLGTKLPEPTRSAPAATPAAPPPSVAATAPASEGDVSKVEEWFKRPENAADDAELTRLTEQRNIIQRAISSTKALLSGAKTPEEKQQHQDILDKQLTPGLENVKKQRKALLDKAKTAMGVAPSTAGGGAAPSTGAGPAGGAMTGGASAPAAPSGGGGGGGASPVAPSTSTGADIGSSSVAVAAGNEPTTPKNETVELNSASTTGSPPASMMPSPVADRGSLDVGITFNTGG